MACWWLTAPKPCCGCGKALRQLAQGNNCYAYGVELDESRAEEAQDTLWLERYAENPASIPSLTELPENRYALPGEPLEAPVFQGEKFNQKELEQQQ